MIGILESHVKSLVGLINLVAFDVAPLENTYIQEDASPTTKYLHIPLTSEIHKDLHSPLRANIKKMLWTKSTSCGKIVIKPSYIRITVYLKRLRPPAWSPQD